MHALGAHFHCRQFNEIILTVKTQSSPSVDVVDDWLSLLLSYVCKLHHVDYTSSVVETVEKVPLKLLPTINGFGFKFGLPVEGVSFESSDELFEASRTSNFTCFDEVSNVLFWIALSIKLLELRWFVPIQHSQIVDTLHIWLKVQRESLSRSTILSFGGV
ncbi:uncharacterized protein E5676_scaffold263G00430 [Cucumis melo var. makuwa]|uniref:Uncharacterized protein n=1 Tax=Cucumis melo var. makuwa TaxID=1194695 RepID=A0A5D3CMY8_CUCMM|nr:uncharacterized protein E5676_scaffold263G00430 [Cucumis melo var. makuwa]